MGSKGSKIIISVFFSIRLWSELLLSLCQIAAIFIRVLYMNMMHNTIVYLPPIVMRPEGDSRRRGLARFTEMVQQCLSM